MSGVRSGSKVNASLLLERLIIEIEDIAPPHARKCNSLLAVQPRNNGLRNSMSD